MHTPLIGPGRRTIFGYQSVTWFDIVTASQATQRPAICMAVRINSWMNEIIVPSGIWSWVGAGWLSLKIAKLLRQQLSHKGWFCFPINTVWIILGSVYFWRIPSLGAHWNWWGYIFFDFGNPLWIWSCHWKIHQKFLSWANWSFWGIYSSSIILLRYGIYVVVGLMSGAEKLVWVQVL